MAQSPAASTLFRQRPAVLRGPVASPGAAQQRPGEPAEARRGGRRRGRVPRRGGAGPGRHPRTRRGREGDVVHHRPGNMRVELTERLAVVVEAEGLVNGPRQLGVRGRMLPLVSTAGRRVLGSSTGPGFERGTPLRRRPRGPVRRAREGEPALDGVLTRVQYGNFKERYVMGPSFLPRFFVHRGRRRCAGGPPSSSPSQLGVAF